MNQIARLTKVYGLSVVLFIYVSICIVLGGAGREGLFWHGVLQSIAAIGSAILVVTWPRNMGIGKAWLPILILVGVAALGAVQSISMPYEIWSSLPGRAIVFEGFEAMDYERGSFPVSLDPDATLMTIGYTLTPIFVILTCLRIGMSRLRNDVPWFLCGVGFVTIIVGLAQVFDGEDSLLYFYAFTSPGAPVGFFSNINHQATLLLMIFPFSIALLMRAIGSVSSGEDHTPTIVLMVGFMFLLLVGVLSAGSVAGYVLLGPTLALSFMAAYKTRTKSSALIGGLSTLALVVISAALVGFSPVLENLGFTSFSNSDVSRLGIWQTTMKAIEGVWPIGSGLGTYESVIPIYEDPEVVTSTFVAKAHNEYLQVIMEGGIFGLLILLLAVIWLARTIFDIWTTTSSSQHSVGVRKSASIALLIIALHSIVDYPARTPAIAAIMGIAIALLSMSTVRPKIARPEVKEHPKRVTL